MFIALIIFIPLFILAINNKIPLENKTGSNSPEAIRQAVYIFIAWVIIIISYIGSGIHCYQTAKDRYVLFFGAKKEKKERVKPF